LIVSKIPISILIPTKDEERNLPSTLESLSWADEIIVFDSFSTDQTVALARRFGCQVHQRMFDNFADHKNWAIRNIPFRNDWILILDADEKVSAELREELRIICGGKSDFGGYYIARQIWVDGVWLKRGGKYPDYQLRLFRNGRAWYERRIVHEHMVVDGRVGYLKNHLVHIDAKGVQRYIERHNRYAEMEAVEALIALRRARRAKPLAALLHGDSVQRRRELKMWAYRNLPFRPVFVFLYTYFFKLGFVMGKAGIKNSVLRMFYEYMIDLYLEELKDPSSPASQKYAAYIEERCREA
jgi:glycosyltransferase involved in cell wall biosynthesis